MGWQLAPLIARIRQEVNAKFPNRDKASDGTIGDADHRKRTSDHNPWVPPPEGGYVTAADIDASGGVAKDLIDWIAENKPEWLKYMIFNRKIMAGDDGPSPWRWRSYNGSNPHTSHGHISVENDDRLYMRSEPLGYHDVDDPDTHEQHTSSDEYEDYNKSAKLGERVLERGSAGDDVAFVQRWVGAKDDGYFGPVTEDKVKRYQGIRSIEDDGIVGPVTWGQMGYGDKKEEPKPPPPKYPLRNDHWFGPESRDPRNHSGFWKADRAPIKMIDKELGDSAPDSRYTDALARKVKEFQKDAGIKVDGLVGPVTWKKLFT